MTELLPFNINKYNSFTRIF